MNHSLDNQTWNAGGSQAKTAAEPAVVAQSCVFDFLVAVAHPVPGIVPLLPDDFLETAADEKLHGVKARLIHVGKDRVHHARGHVVRPQARVAVAQRGINDADLFHNSLDGYVVRCLFLKSTAYFCCHSGQARPAGASRNPGIKTFGFPSRFHETDDETSRSVLEVRNAKLAFPISGKSLPHDRATRQAKVGIDS